MLTVSAYVSLASRAARSPYSVRYGYAADGSERFSIVYVSGGRDRLVYRTRSRRAALRAYSAIVARFLRYP